MNAQEFYDLGCLHQQKGNLQEALSCYMQAIELDPNSPAVEAKKILDSIFNFYCKDIYNPQFRNE